ncbi:MAG: hypothetical protein ACPGQS_03555 [Bradymonadia bacterium]
MTSMDRNKKSTHRLAEFVVEQNLVSQDDMNLILKDIAGLNVDLPFVLYKRGLIEEERIARVLSDVFELPMLKQISPDAILTTLNVLPVSAMEQFRLLPIGCRVDQQKYELEIVTANPFTIIDWMPAHPNLCLRIQISTSSEIKRGLAHAVEKQTESNIHLQVIDQLLESKMITTAQVEFAQQQVLKRAGNRSVVFGSNSTTGHQS